MWSMRVRSYVQRKNWTRIWSQMVMISIHLKCRVEMWKQRFQVHDWNKRIPPDERDTVERNKNMEVLGMQSFEVSVLFVSKIVDSVGKIELNCRMNRREKPRFPLLLTITVSWHKNVDTFSNSDVSQQCVWSKSRSRSFFHFFSCSIHGRSWFPKTHLQTRQWTEHEIIWIRDDPSLLERMWFRRCHPRCWSHGQWSCGDGCTRGDRTMPNLFDLGCMNNRRGCESQMTDRCPSWLPVSQHKMEKRVGPILKHIAQFGDIWFRYIKRIRCHFIFKPYDSMTLYWSSWSKGSSSVCTKGGVVRGESWTKQPLSDE